ncbi:hypothetical protein QE152_g25948 [Popillia japonica]|uniref:Uncharacterized protein n=1 Tax=Popillia japonica TaxID=7064 RepID=A0AAW1JYA2_POPJA
MADLEAVLADVSYLMAMEKSKCTPAARASKKIILPDPSVRSVMHKYLEKKNEVSFDKIFHQTLEVLAGIPANGSLKRFRTLIFDQNSLAGPPIYLCRFRKTTILTNFVIDLKGGKVPNFVIDLKGGKVPKIEHDPQW